MPKPSLDGIGGKNSANQMGSVGMGMPVPMMQTLQKWGRGKGPAWLNPADYFNGSLQNDLTGDTSKDMRYGLARYGLFAAPWMPALAYESNKKGNEIKDQQNADAARANQQQMMDNIQPYQRQPGYTSLNPYLNGRYNSMAAMLNQNSQMGGLL